MSFQRIARRFWMSAAALAVCAGLSAHAADAPEAAAPAAPQAVAPATPADSKPIAAEASAPVPAAPAAVAPAASGTDAPTATPVAPPAVVPTGPAITVDFAPLPNRTVYAQYKNDVKMSMSVEAAGETADAPKSQVKKADVSMVMAIGTRQNIGARAKDGSMTMTSTTERFDLQVTPEDVARMMQDEVGDLKEIVGTRSISRVTADGRYELIRVEPAKGKSSDRSVKPNELDQMVAQIPQGKHVLRVGESLSMTANYPSQGGMMPMALDVELVFTLSKIDGTVAFFDITPKMQFESDNPMFKDARTSGSGTLVFDTKRHLVQDLKLTLKVDARAEMGPGMSVSTSIVAAASGSESLKPLVQAATAKAAPAKKAKQKG